MRKIVLSISALLLCGVMAVAQEVRDVRMVHEGDSVAVSMTVDLSALEVVKGAVAFVPVLYKDSVVFQLPPIGLYSRERFYSAARQARSDNPLTGYNYYTKQAPDTVYYEASVPYRPWMDGASLRLDNWATGCCNRVLSHTEGEPLFAYSEPQVAEPVVIDEGETPEEPEITPEEEGDLDVDDKHIPVIVTNMDDVETPGEVEVDDIPEEQGSDEQVERIPFVPHFIYVHPEAEAVVKERDISGEASVIFRSGATDLDPAYKDNEAELQKIRATIDSVRFDPDITITGVYIRGFSSPDGAYSVNQQLSEKRVGAIRSYVEEMVELPEDLWHFEAVAENWEGLRAAVEASSLSHRDDILEIIDSDLEPDKKEYQIRKRYARDYNKIFNDIYPLLRRTNYKVSYTVRSYTSVEEVRAIMRTKPWNLSIKEFFLAADGLKPGSEEFNEVFEIAARVYPSDPIANINAANAAMNAGNLAKAAYYLEKVGDSPEARYTKGLYAALQENYEEAARYFSSALLSGYEDARAPLELVETILKQMEGR